MRLLLILPRDATYRYRGAFKRSLSYAPLTLTTLAALVPDHLRAEITLVDEGVEPFEPNGKPFDVVGITAVTASAPRAYTLAESFRERKAFVVLGGSHATLNPEEAATHADAVIAGYAERLWPKLLEDLAAGRTPSAIRRDEMTESLPSPVPRRDLLPKHRYLRVPTVLASRGCRNFCSFCSIPRIWQQQACSRPVPEVIEEIRRLKSKSILFLDPNLIANREYARELFEALIPLRIRWAGLATIELAEDPELFRLAVQSGCLGILIGFESICADSLHGCGKPVCDVTRYREGVRKFHDHHMGVLGCFVFGFDEDDETIFEKTLTFIDEVKLDLPRFAVLTPFPGTALFDQFRKDGRIITEDWSRYDTGHVIFRPRNMSADTLQSGFLRTWRAAYAGGRILRRVTRAGRGWPLSLASNMGFRFYAKSVNRSGDKTE
jgi:radical SAM superfamily enzyme YgiQ (UPF0313 family)